MEKALVLLVRHDHAPAAFAKPKAAGPYCVEGDYVGGDVAARYTPSSCSVKWDTPLV